MTHAYSDAVESGFPAKLGPDGIDVLAGRWAIERPDLDVAPLAVLGRLHQAFMRYHASAGLVVAQYGLTMATFDILVTLRTAGAPFRMTAGELATSGFITTGGLTQRVDRLVSQGLARRVADALDRRIVMVEMTPRGLAVIDEAVAPHFRNEDLMLTDLSGDERRHLAALLKKLLPSFEHAATRGDGRPRVQTTLERDG